MSILYYRYCQIVIFEYRNCRNTVATATSHDTVEFLSEKNSQIQPDFKEQSKSCSATKDTASTFISIYPLPHTYETLHTHSTCIDSTCFDMHQISMPRHRSAQVGSYSSKYSSRNGTHDPLLHMHVTHRSVFVC